MARNEGKRQKRLAKKKSKRKSKKAKLNVETALSSNLSVLANRAAKMPIYECFVPEELEDTGIGSVVFSRKISGGQIAVSIILLDTYCLGVKDNAFRVLSLLEYEQILSDMKMHETLAAAEPACARKLVEDCIIFARNIGFEPHSDYKYAAKMFGDVDAADCNETFPFGKDGKPLYIAGPFDSKQKADKIFKTLTRTCGEGDFDFVLPVSEDELDFIFED